MRLAAGAVARRSSVAGFVAVVRATAEAEARRRVAYTIHIIRGPVFPALYYLTLLLAYRAAGRSVVAGVDVEGYLLVGMIGILLWSSNLWASGYAIEHERQEGTLLALLLTPASRSAVVLGYGLGDWAVWVLPSVVVTGLLAWAFGVELAARDPLAVLLAAISLLGSTLALGYALAGLFVLSRRANLLANFLQSPVYLLGGMAVPVSALPAPLDRLAAVFPISAGMDALRLTLLAGASLDAIAPVLLELAALSVALLLAGVVGLRLVERAAKRGDELGLE
jgi:ABC-2 type transport system permease protein